MWVTKIQPYDSKRLLVYGFSFDARLHPKTEKVNSQKQREVFYKKLKTAVFPVV